MKEQKKKVTNKAKTTRSKKVASTSTKNNNKSMDNMKYEIASELGVNLGAESTSRANGSVGGEITKRLVQNGKNKLSSNQNRKSK